MRYIGHAIREEVRLMLHSHSVELGLLYASELQGRGSNLTPPTESSDTLEKDAFHKQLHTVLEELPNDDVVILMGDLNG